MKPLIVLILYWCFCQTLFAESKKPWIEYARGLTANTKNARKESIKGLKGTANLKTKLVRALSTSNRYLALDVIAALSLKGFVDPLLTLSPADEDGFLVLSLNSLIDNKNLKKITQAYKSQIETNTNLTAATTIAMLEPLGRLNTPLSPGTLNRLFNHSFHEVRRASLLYLDYQVRKFGWKKYEPFLRHAFSASPFQNRIQTIFIIKRAMPPKLALSWLKGCTTDSNHIVQRECNRAIKELSGA